MLINLAGGAAALPIYLLLAGTISAHEVIAAALVAVLIALWSIAARRASPHRFAASGEHVRVWTRALAVLPLAVVRTGTALLAPRSMMVVVRPFRQGTRDDPADRARRATAILAASLAPSSFVVRANPEEAQVLIHAVRGTAIRDDPDWLT